MVVVMFTAGSGQETDRLFYIIATARGRARLDVSASQCLSVSASFLEDVLGARWPVLGFFVS